ncbi:MAG: uroporphyrinogen-III synthase [Rhodocyclaceae bacterium]|nr:uroporphyrinogen-III synthase [Rhodocyclaceae bacterium]
MSIAGKHIVITRPVGQSAHLAESLTALGAHPVLFPVLAISDLEDTAPLLEVAIHLEQYQFAVFVSPNAVEKALSVILAHRTWPPSLRAVTVGKSSEAALARFGITDILAPVDQFDSEHLIALPELQNINGSRVIIFRGDGGRPLLGDTLKNRGAQIDYVTCYRRSQPKTSAIPLLKRWEAGTLSAVILTSSEGLRNLMNMMGKLGQAWLIKTPVFVPHERIAEQARQLGLGQIIQTAPADEGLLAGLIHYFHEHP